MKFTVCGRSLRRALLNVSRRTRLRVNPESSEPGIMLIKKDTFVLGSIAGHSIARSVSIFRTSEYLHRVVTQCPRIGNVTITCYGRVPFGCRSHLVPLSVKTHFVECFAPSLRSLTMVGLCTYHPGSVVSLRDRTFISQLS